ncbi:MAG: gluconokinase [Ginsengibacter sp.]
MSSNLSVGIDIGTGSIKAVAINSKGEVLSSELLNYPLNRGIITEKDPIIIWNTFITLLKSFLEKINQKPSAITLSSCMHSLILVDINNEPLTAMISWADNRSSEIASELRLSKIAKQLYQETGTPIHGMSPLCKIIWFKQNEPELFMKTAKFISIKEFIWYKLFKTYQIDYSVASATGLFNIRTLNWNPRSLQLAGITNAKLSEIVSTSYLNSTAHTDLDDFLKQQTFVIGSSDGCLANLGSNAIKNGDIALTIGTSGAVRVTSGSVTDDFKTMTFNYVLDETTFISGGPVNNGGNIVQWLIRTLLNKVHPSESDYSFLFNDIAKIAPGSEGLLFLPYLNGERAPVWDENATGSYFGITSNHTRAHFLRAAVEGICFSLNQLIAQMDHCETDCLHVSGGFIKSPVWVQMLSDISGKQLLISDDVDSSALGACYMGLKTLRIIKNYNEIIRNTSKIITPDKTNHVIYKKYFDVFVNIYPTTKILSEKLNHLAKNAF